MAVIHKMQQRSICFVRNLRITFVLANENLSEDIVEEIVAALSAFRKLLRTRYTLD